MSRNVLNYELYGDLLAGRAPEPIHIEPIRERSSKHNWTIRVHSHKRLAQIFLFKTAGVDFKVGDVSNLTSQPTLLVVHPDIPHGFHFPETIVGEVLSVRMDDVPFGLRKRFANFRAATDGIFLQSDTPRFDDIATLFEQIRRTYFSLSHDRVEIMTALVDLIMLYCVEGRSTNRQLKNGTALNHTNDRGIQAEAFCTLVEETYRKAWAVPDYAAQLGVSASHLTRICRQSLGAPPNALLRQRRILEAKRLLEYTGLPLSEIAYRSGFRDTAFFSRTFKLLVGVSPNAYRASLERRHRPPQQVDTL